MFTVDVKQQQIDEETTRKEWGLVKPLVIKSGYPRDKMPILWGLINTYPGADKSIARTPGTSSKLGRASTISSSTPGRTSERKFQKFGEINSRVY